MHQLELIPISPQRNDTGIVYINSNEIVLAFAIPMELIPRILEKGAYIFQQIGPTLQEVLHFLSQHGAQIIEGIGNMYNASSDDGESKELNVKYPGNDSSKTPGKNWEWRGKREPGSNQGNWYNPKIGESLHIDINHTDPIGPHWDYKTPDGKWYRVHPDGSIVPK